MLGLENLPSLMYLRVTDVINCVRFEGTKTSRSNSSMFFQCFENWFSLLISAATSPEHKTTTECHHAHAAQPFNQRYMPTTTVNAVMLQRYFGRLAG